MYRQSLGGEWRFREAGTEAWLPAQVPGCVHTDLLAAGRIPDPYVGDNERRVQWVSERDWEYTLAFEAAPELLAEQRLFLVCDGLDTVAEVTLNGQPVGNAANMFRRYRWDITGLLAEGENELCVRFTSPVDYMAARQAEEPIVSYAWDVPGRGHMRRVRYQAGTDWGIRLLTVGIWQDIRLEGYTVARLDDVHLRQHHADGSVTVSAGIEVERWEQAPLRAEVRLTSPDGVVQKVVAPLDGDAGTATPTLAVSDPQLWWPNDHGPQPLYGVEIVLYHGERECDRRAYQLGLRTVTLRQEPDRYGTSFTLVVNGMPIFAKGATLLTADTLFTRVTDAQLEHLVRSAAAVHMNILRVHGTTLYGEDRLYDLCDRYGIMVWQEFAFSLSAYPGTDEFVENVRHEAIDNVRRLRHRASLVLWCGDSEVEMWWVRRSQGVDQRYKAAYYHQAYHLLRDVCAQEDPDHSYWPSSPSSGLPFHEPTQSGDVHYYGVWHGGAPITAYREQFPRYVGEFGFQSLPAFDTIRAFADEDEWNVSSYMLDYHQRNKSGNGNAKILAYLADHFRIPKDFESTIYVSQLMQAEALRVGVEHWRRHCDCTSGTMFVFLNDPWPIVSWSIMDYFGRWKAAFYAARRFYAPVLLSAEDEGTRVSLHVTNDQKDEWAGTVRWTLETLDGQVLESGEQIASVPATSAALVKELDYSGNVDADNQRDVVLVYELWQGDERLSQGLVPFLPSKHLALEDPELDYTVAPCDKGWEIAVTARKAARFVWLALVGADAIFGDNYFDLPAGRTAVVTLPAMAGWTVERVRDALRVRSLFNSYV